MSEVTELIERLRAKRMRVHDLSGVGWEDDPDCHQAADALATLTARVAELERERDQALDHAAMIMEACEATEAQLAKAVEALTPSGETKAAYIGEFSFMIDEVVTSDDGDEVENRREVTVPWTTVKEIMAAIRARAALSELEG